MSVKNGVIGSHWVMMTRDTEELTSHGIHAKDCDFNASKIAEAVILLDLIKTVRKNYMTLIQVKHTFTCAIKSRGE